MPPAPICVPIGVENLLKIDHRVTRMAIGETSKTHGFHNVKPTLGHSWGDRKSVFVRFLVRLFLFSVFFCEKVCFQLRFWLPIGARGGVHEITFSMFFRLWTAWEPKWLPELPPELPGPPQAPILDPTCSDSVSHWGRKLMNK